VLVGVALVATLIAGCKPTLKHLSKWLGEGNAIVILCKDPNLVSCSAVTAVNLVGGTTRWDHSTFPNGLGDNQIRSLLMICGIPAAIVAYENRYFQGRLEEYHCQPGATLQINDIRFRGAAPPHGDGRASGLVVTRDDYATTYSGGGLTDPIFKKLGIDMSLAMDGFDAAVAPELEAEEDIESADTWSSAIFWTDLHSHYAALGMSAADELRRRQVIGFANGMELDPNWWPSNYDVQLEWYLEPTIVAGTIPRLKFELKAWSLWVEDGFIRDEIYEGISSEMEDAGAELADTIRQQIVDTITAEASAAGIPGDVGELMLSSVSSVGWTISQPRPCNPHVWPDNIDFTPAYDVCALYRAVPPLITVYRN
jgi:hypothetical protein